MKKCFTIKNILKSKKEKKEKKVWQKKEIARETLKFISLTNRKIEITSIEW